MKVEESQSMLDELRRVRERLNASLFVVELTCPVCKLKGSAGYTLNGYDIGEVFWGLCACETSPLVDQEEYRRILHRQATVLTS